MRSPSKFRGSWNMKILNSRGDQKIFDIFDIFRFKLDETFTLQWILFCYFTLKIFVLLLSANRNKHTFIQLAHAFNYVMWKTAKFKGRSENFHFQGRSEGGGGSLTRRQSNFLEWSWCPLHTVVYKITIHQKMLIWSE